MYYGNYGNIFAQQGWQCPICGRVYSPSTPMCLFCGGRPGLGRIEITCGGSGPSGLLTSDAVPFALGDVYTASSVGYDDDDCGCCCGCCDEYDYDPEKDW